MEVPGIERVFDTNHNVISIILRGSFDKEGIAFVTPNDLSQQLGYIHHPAGRVIEPHVHNRAPREVQFTQEVLLLRKGSIRADFYDSDREYLESTTLRAGDTVVLIQGGHGFECLEETIMIEVKQGPHIGDQDKTRFRAVAPDLVRIRKVLS